MLNKETKILELLLAHEKVDLDKSDESERTIFQMAVMRSKGANPNIADENKITLLHWAAKFAKNPDIVELLLNQKDVDINCLDNFEENALDYAKVNEHGLGERITNLLIEKGVVEAPVKTSRTSHEYEKIKNILDMLPSESKEVTSQFENLLIDESVKLEKIVEVAVLYTSLNCTRGCTVHVAVLFTLLYCTRGCTVHMAVLYL